MINTSAPQILYGGTFDPLHYGHIKSVEALANLINIQEIIIIPNNIPPHRPKPKASFMHRKAMVELAIANRSLFRLHEHKFDLNSLPYTAQLLQAYRAKHGPNKPIAFIVGQDSLLNFHSWYQYETVLNNSHLIVCRRPGYPNLVKDNRYYQWLKKYLTQNALELYSIPFGKVFLAETPWFDISSTIIRDRLQNGKTCENLIPPLVIDYIFRHGLYQKNKK